jgi:hypothetical protein
MNSGSAALPAQIQQAVEDALAARLGGRRSIVRAENIWPSSVFRCALQTAGSVGPKTVIVRLPREETGDCAAIGLHNEQAALEYLTAIGSPLAPRFLAGGQAEGFLVTEDLGDYPSLLDQLLGNNAEAAQQGLIAFVTSLGRLHAKTSAGSYHRMRAVLPVARVSVVENWHQALGAVSQLNLPVPQNADGDIEAIACLLAASDDCLSLSSGDPSVVNCKVINGSVRFFDFEYGCLRHPFVDAAVLRYPYPTGGPPWQLPEEIEIQMEAAYRAELARGCPLFGDDSRYEHSMAAACAAWTILRLVRLPRVEAGPDRDPWLLLPPGWSAPVPLRSRRRQLLAILETCIASLRRANVFTDLAAWCECLLEALRRRWPEAHEAIPRYPAF